MGVKTEYNAMVEQDNATITSIRVSNYNGEYYTAEIIEKHPHDAGVILKDTDTSRYLNVLNKAHAESVIRGLQKAIELGWV